MSHPLSSALTSPPPNRGTSRVVALARTLLLLSGLFPATTAAAALVPRADSSYQLINYAALPSCAQQCTTLTTAQSGCVPPAAAVTDQQTYVSCFCQSAFLSTLYSTASGVCDSACPSASDQSTIQQWYINFCKNGVGGVSAVSSTATATTSATAGATAGSGLTGASTDDFDDGRDSSDSYSGSWISAHWKWIVMLIIIFLAMIFFSILGVWFKRRHNARRDALAANLAARDACINPVPAPPMAQKHPDSTLSSTVDLGGPSSSNPGVGVEAGAAGSASAASLATAGASGAGSSARGTPMRPRGRPRTATLTRFPNGSMTNIQPAPVVWGPHQHQAATRGYEYNSPGSPTSFASPHASLSDLGVPTPTLTPVGKVRDKNSVGALGGSNADHTAASTGNGKGKAQEVISEVASVDHDHDHDHSHDHPTRDARDATNARDAPTVTNASHLPTAPIAPTAPHVSDEKRTSASVIEERSAAGTPVSRVSAGTPTAEGRPRRRLSKRQSVSG